MNTLVDFLFPAPARRSIGGIVTWWESRRLMYNLIVGAAGGVSVPVVAVVTSLPPYGHASFPPVVLILLFGALANVCYLLGPFIEIALEKLWGRRALPAGPTLYRIGLSFSVGLALLPSMIVGFDWAFRIVRWLF